MKKWKKSVITILLLLTSVIVFAGCGNKTDGTDTTATEHTTGTENSGVGASTENSTQTKDDNLGEGMENAADDIGDAAEDVIDDAGKAVDDVADGVGDAIDNLGGGSFDSYDAAKTYLLEKLKKDNAGANYEVREETKDLTSYNNNDSGAEGYQFSVYETDGNEKIGIYYVDKDTGKIYRYMGKNSIEAY